MALELVTVLGGCALGAALGARHALEPDHLAAVSTLVAERPRARQAAWLGALWGVGHTAALVIVGVALVIARDRLPDPAVVAAELVVAVMLIVLGARSLAVAWRGGIGPERVHHHREVVHRHGGASGHLHLGDRPLALRPLMIGLVHGLAGSGGLTALALAEMPTTGGAVGYIAAFGIGSVVGMAALSGLAGASLGRIARGPLARARVMGAAGALSVFVGIGWAATLAVTWAG